jgi:AraC-like DNA-binding protein
MLVSSLLVRIVVEAAKRRGLSERALRRELGVASNEFERHARVPLAVASKVWEGLPRIVEDPALGIHAVEEMAPTDYGALIALIESSKTWGEGMLRLARRLALVNPAAGLTIEHEPAQARLVLNTADGVRTGVDLLTTAICLRTRAVLGPQATPVSARYAFRAPRDALEYERALGVPVDFEAKRTELTFSRELWDCCVVGNTTERADEFERLLDRASRPEAPPPASEPELALTGSDFVDRVRLAVDVCLENGTSDLASIARALNTSPRTLQRHLKSADLRLRQLVAEQRAQVLTQTRYSKAIAARLLGYADRRSLRRAQVRWGE